MPGKIAAQITAKSVIASAARLIDVRHFWRSKNKIAEISVPACPIPIQKTKLVMSQAQPTGTDSSPGADAGGNLIADAEKAKRRNARSDRESHPPPARRGLFDDAGDPLA